MSVQIKRDEESTYGIMLTNDKNALYTDSQTVNNNLLFEILQELKTMSKKLDNLHRLYKP